MRFHDIIISMNAFKLRNYEYDSILLIILNTHCGSLIIMLDVNRNQLNTYKNGTTSYRRLRRIIITAPTNRNRTKIIKIESKGFILFLGFYSDIK